MHYSHSAADDTSIDFDSRLYSIADAIVSDCRCSIVPISAAAPDFIYMRCSVPRGNIGLSQYAITAFHAALGSAPHGNPLSYTYSPGLGNTRHVRLFGFDCILHPFHMIEPMSAVTLGIDGQVLHSITDFLFECIRLSIFCSIANFVAFDCSFGFVDLSIAWLKDSMFGSSSASMFDVPKSVLSQMHVCSDFPIVTSV